MSIGMVGSIDFIELVAVESGLKAKRHSAHLNCGLQIADCGLRGME